MKFIHLFFLILAFSPAKNVSASPCEYSEIKPSFKNQSVLFDSGAWKIELKNLVSEKDPWDPAGNHSLTDNTGNVICEIQSQPVEKIYSFHSINEMNIFYELWNWSRVKFFQCKNL